MFGHYVYYYSNNFRLFDNPIAAPAANVHDYIDDVEYELSLHQSLRQIS